MGRFRYCFNITVLNDFFAEVCRTPMLGASTQAWFVRVPAKPRPALPMSRDPSGISCFLRYFRNLRILELVGLPICWDDLDALGYAAGSTLERLTTEVDTEIPSHPYPTLQRFRVLKGLDLLCISPACFRVDPDVLNGSSLPSISRITFRGTDGSFPIYLSMIK
jgi:hypothetical protein